jgi:hypothetical protein
MKRVVQLYAHRKRLASYDDRVVGAAASGDAGPELETDWVTDEPPPDVPTTVSTTRVSYTRRHTTSECDRPLGAALSCHESNARTARNAASVNITTVSRSGPAGSDALGLVVATAVAIAAVASVAVAFAAARSSHRLGR